MKIFAVSDLHLAHNDSKKMDIFGEHWQGHFEKIKRDWEEKVSDEDIVLMPGDLSWAMALDDAKEHLKSVCELKGKKILLRGNHDYWWSSLTKVRSLLFGETYALQNDCVQIGDYVFCGTRGWLLPGDKSFNEQEDRSIFEREKQRLVLSLDSAKKHIANGKKLIVIMHYPPLYPQLKNTDFSDIIESYPAKKVVFGHLHGKNISRDDFSSYEKQGIEYNLVSCDFLGFKLKQII